MNFDELLRRSKNMREQRSSTRTLPKENGRRLGGLQVRVRKSGVGTPGPRRRSGMMLTLSPQGRGIDRKAPRARARARAMTDTERVVSLKTRVRDRVP